MERHAPYSDADTSRDAAESVEPHIERLQEMILCALKGSGPGGLCCFEIEEQLGLIHQTASARIRGLVLEKLVEASGVKRPTRTGRMAKAWRISLQGTREWAHHPAGWDDHCECQACGIHSVLEQVELF